MSSGGAMGAPHPAPPSGGLSKTEGGIAADLYFRDSDAIWKRYGSTSRSSGVWEQE